MNGRGERNYCRKKATDNGACVQLILIKLAAKGQYRFRMQIKEHHITKCSEGKNLFAPNPGI